MKNDKEKLKKPDGLTTASPWRRFGGWMADFLLWTAAWLWAVWWLVTADTIAVLLYSLVIVVSLGMVGVFLSLLVTAGLTSGFGGTVGKLVFGMEVVDEQGKTLSFWRAVWREWFGSWVSGMALWSGFIWIFIDKDRRGWHDMMAGSKVVVGRNFLVIGLLTIAILLAINAAAMKAVGDKAELNSRLYQEIFQMEPHG